MDASTNNEIIPAASFKQIDIGFVTPAASIKRFVQCIWVIDNPEGSATTLNEKFYPDAGASLTFYLDQTNCEAQLFYHTQVCAMPWELACRQISVRFRPGALKYLFGLTFDDSKNQQIDIALAMVKQRDSYQRLQAYLIGKTISQQCLAIQHWLIELAENTDGAFQKWERMLYQSMNLLVPPQHLADQFGGSRRTLERQFRTNFGFSPNKLYQFAQIRHARSLLTSNSEALSHVALACGYFDQAHFTHSFSDFALETPLQYRKRKLSQIYN